MTMLRRTALLLAALAATTVLIAGCSSSKKGATGDAGTSTAAATTKADGSGAATTTTSTAAGATTTVAGAVTTTVGSNGGGAGAVATTVPPTTTGASGAHGFAGSSSDPGGYRAGNALVFRSADGKFTCAIVASQQSDPASGRATCQGAKTPLPAKTTCSQAWRGWQVDGAGSVTFVCTSSPPSGATSGAKVLPAGATLTNGNLACAGTANGASCIDVRSGHGFLVSTASYQQF